MTRPVVVTGVGLVTPLGCGRKPTWSNLLAGQSGIAPVELPELPGVKLIGGTVPGFSVREFVKDPKSVKTMTRQTQLVVAAASMACDQAGIRDLADGHRVGVYLGAGFEDTSVDEISPAVRASLDESGEFNLRIFGRTGFLQLSPLFGIRKLPNMALSHISIAHNAKGQNLLLSPSAASGVQAIGEGFEAIRRNEIDIALVGGCDAKVNLPGYIRYKSMGLLSTNLSPKTASRPFDRQRNGIVLGEGAAILVVEEATHARARGAKPLAEIAGYGTAFFDPSESDQKVVGTLRLAMERALERGSTSVHSIDFIQANGASTVLHDKLECLAIQSLLGSRSRTVPVSATKSSFGHLIGASGAVDTAACTLALEEQCLYPISNLERVDAFNALALTRNTSKVSIGTALVNSIGFEGTSASLVLRTYNG